MRSSTHSMGLGLVVLSHLCTSAKPAVQSLNPAFFGTWRGLAPTRNLCSNEKNKNGESPITLTIEKSHIQPGKNYVVPLKGDWGCFAPKTTPGFIFGNEFWAASDDRMTFVRLYLEEDGTVSGKFRFDLNGLALQMDFKDFKKVVRESK